MANRRHPRRLRSSLHGARGCGAAYQEPWTCEALFVNVIRFV